MTRGKARRRRDRVLLLIVIALLLAIVGLLTALLLRGGSDTQTSTTARRDPNAAVGQIKGKTKEEIQAELNRIVEEGMFNISINSDIRYPSGTAEGDVRIENIAANRYLMRVRITLDDTGEVVYETAIIEPGYHIQTDALDVALEKGVYNATALFTAYDPDTEAVVGQAGAKVRLTIES